MLLGSKVLFTSIIVAIWGMVFGTVPVAWSTWLSRAVPDETESAGGLLVANIQLGMGIGAAAGGLIFDWSGSNGVFIGSGAILLIAAFVIGTAIPSKRVNQKT